jgi:hypothetical protein
MRFSARRKVDFPQPLGPMIAVTFRAGSRIVTSCKAWRAPYQRLKSLISNAISSGTTGKPAGAAEAGATAVRMEAEEVEGGSEIVDI